MARVALATCGVLPDGDEDAPLLLEALRSLGIEGRSETWDDPRARFEDYDLVIVRSTWDYAQRRDAFLEWAGQVACKTRLLNPLDVLRWNTDKVYLRELEAAGVPIVPTLFVEPGEEPVIPWDSELVVKPAISAGAKDTFRIAGGEISTVRSRVAELHEEGRTAMIQPYLSRVDEAGETALIVLGGELSHAIRKAAILSAGGGRVQGLHAQEQIASREPRREELELLKRVLEVLPASEEPLLYARLDLIPGADGEPRVIELELAEPSLFLTHERGAIPRFASLIAERARALS